MRIIKYDNDTLRTELTRVRRQKRMTQSEVAASIGCNRKWVSDFERGLAGNNVIFIVAYAQLLGFDFLISCPDETVDLSG